MSKIISIHQPNYLPWLGFFHKILYSDTFVFLDSVQYTPKTFTNRSYILQNGSSIRLTIPVSLNGWNSNINDVKVDTNMFSTKHLKSFEISYKKTKYFQNIMDIIYPTFKIGKTNLAEFNIILIKSILKYLNVDIKLVCLSKLNIFTKKNQLLIDITKACNGDIFVSGTGAKNYISGNELLYKKNNIQLAYQNFNHPYYKQLKEPFTYKMSIVDLLFNYGEESLNILKSVQKPDYINI